MKNIIKKLNRLLIVYISISTLGIFSLISPATIFLEKDQLKLSEITFAITIFLLVAFGLILFILFIRLIFFNISLKRTIKQFDKQLNSSRLNIIENNILHNKKIIEYQDSRLKSSCLIYKKYLKNLVLEFSDEQY